MTRARIAAATAALALTAGGIGTFAATAGASSAGCENATGALAGSCSDEVTATGTGWAVKGGTAKTDTPIVAATGAASVTDGSTDFYVSNTTGNASQRTFEFAPNGKRSGFCISQPEQNGGLVLRACNGSDYQSFYGLGDPGNDTGNRNDGIQWMNVAFERVPEVSGTSIVMAGLDASASVPGSYFHWAG